MVLPRDNVQLYKMSKFQTYYIFYSRLSIHRIAIQYADLKYLSYTTKMPEIIADTVFTLTI